MVKSTYKIPFDSNGNQLDYAYAAFPHGNQYVSMVDNFEFTDTLTFVGYGRGRSSVTFDFSRSDGTHVSVFVSSFSQMIPRMVHGTITGTFTFVKKGSNYGCTLVNDKLVA